MLPTSYLPKKRTQQTNKPPKKTAATVRDESATGADEDLDEGEYEEEDEAQQEERQLPAKSGKQGHLTKRAERILNTRFGEKAPLIIEQLEFGVTDGVTSLITRSLLQSLVDVLPMAERQIRKSGATKGIYQYNQTIGSIRELLADIQASQDRGMLGQSIVEKAVRPAFLDISVQIVTAMAEFEAFAKNNMEPEQRKEFRELVETINRSLATYISTQYREVSETVVQSLS